MRRNVPVALAALLLTLAGSPAGAQSTSALLEKGIYTEQTVGDIDGAIEIYRDIVEQGMAHRPHVAEALFRLGICHLKNDDPAAATEVFEQIISDYAEQERFVLLARENMPQGPEALELLPTPWRDGEVMRFGLKFSSGTPIGTMLMSADSTDLDGEDLWRLRVRRKILSDSDNQAIGQVLVRKDGMAPLSSTFKHSVIGHYEAVYDDGSVRITTVGTDSVREEKLDARVFDNEQGFHLFRRLPLEEGYETRVHVITSVAGSATPIDVEITGTEMVTVPAGEFECYRMKLSVPQTMWYSTDPSHTLVKFEGSGIIGELEEVFERDPDERLVYRDEGWEYDLSAPPGWLFYELREGVVRTLLLLDPNADTQARVELHPSHGSCTAQTASWRKLEQARAYLPAYKLRDGTWSERKISDRDSLSFIGDYTENDIEKVHYWTFVDSGELCLEFTLKTSAELFDAYREEFDTIIESYDGPRAQVREPTASPSRAAVKQVIDDFHLAATRADTKRPLDHLAPDLVFVGSDPRERLDRDAFRARIEDSFLEGQGWTTVSGEQHIVVRDESGMAWFDERLESRTVGDVRASGVLRRDDGRWRIVQYHLALPVPNSLARDLIEKSRALDREKPSAAATAPENDPARGAWRVLDDLHRAKAESNRDRFFGHIAEDAVLMGTDRAERFTVPEYRTFAAPFFDRGVQHQSFPVERNVFLSPDGKIAWFDELVERSDYGELRGTGVLYKEGETWKVVHYNLVFPVPHELSEELVLKIRAFYAPEG